MSKTILNLVFILVSFVALPVSATEGPVMSQICREHLNKPSHTLIPIDVANELIRHHRAESSPTVRKTIKDRIVLGYLPLFETQFGRRCRKYGASVYEDCRDEIVRALLVAFQKFDINKDASYYTYARYWVREAVSTLLEKLVRGGIAGDTRLLREHSAGYSRAVAKRIGAGLPINSEEIAKELGLSVQDFQELRLIRSVNTVSNDSPTYENEEEDGNSVGDKFLSKEAEVQSESAEALDRLNLIRKLKEFQATLTDPRHVAIFENRYILSAMNIEPDTRVEIGKQMGLSDERVRQIEVKLLKALQEFLGVDPAQVKAVRW